MAGSGWCHHPLRKTTNELLIMVRRNELACRDQWSHCLWEEGTWEPEPMPSDAARGDDPIRPGQPLLPATEGDIAALLRADRAERPLTASALPQEDVVLGEARLATDRTPPWRREAPPAEPRRDYDPRTAIKKAREAYRERIRAQEAARAAALADVVPLAVEGAGDSTSEHPGIVDGPDPASDPDGIDEWTGPDDAAPIASEAAFPMEPGPESGDSPSKAAEATSFDAVAASDESSDEADGVDPDADWWTTDESDPGAPFAEWAEPDSESPEEAEPAEPVRASASVPVGDPSYGDASQRRDPATSWFGDELAPPPLGAIASPWSVASATGSAGSPVAEMDEAEDAWPDDDDSWMADDAGTTSATVVGSMDDRSDPHLADALGDELGERGGPETATEAFDERIAEAALDAPPARPVIQLLPIGSVAPGAPRICRTCRDFRPAEGGERGWCANQWAFTTRQMVHPDDPAPCESSAGSWWLPTDDLCLADADVSTHGQPTPHLDRWLPHHRERVAERKRS